MEKWNCENCNFQTYSMLLFYKHRCKPWELKMETEAEDSNTTPFDCANILELYKCTNCDFYTKMKILLESHVKEVHNDQALCDSASQKSYSCAKCNFQTCSVLELYKHVCTLVRSIRNEKPTMWFQCEHCKFKSKWKRCLNMHLIIHSHKWLYCLYCEFKTKRECNLTLHLKKKHEGVMCFKCKYCESGFVKKLQLKRHMKEQHAVKNRKWNCKHCVFKTNDGGILKNHMNAIHATEPKSNLINHWELEHTVNCMYCKQIFMLTSQLRKHVAEQHSVEDSNAKPFHCQHCDYKARFANSLEAHMFAKHKDHQINIIISKEYKCKQCENAFRLKADLRRHKLEAHQSPRIEKLSCKTWRYRLKSKIIGLKCGLCEITFLVKKDLERHVLEVHSNKVEELVHRDQYEDKISYLSILKDHDYSIQPFSYISSPISLNDVTDILQVFQETENKKSICIKPTIKL